MWRQTEASRGRQICLKISISSYRHVNIGVRGHPSPLGGRLSSAAQSHFEKGPWGFFLSVFEILAFDNNSHLYRRFIIRFLFVGQMRPQTAS